MAAKSTFHFCLYSVLIGYRLATRNVNLSCCQAESLIDMNWRVGSGLLKSMESGSENLADSLEDLI